MEDGTSSQERTPLLSLERRPSFWLSFQVLVQRFKDALGLGAKGPTELERLQSELNVYREEIEATKRAAEEAEATSKSQLTNLTDKLATEAEENRLLRDQLQETEQAHLDYEKDREAHLNTLENRLEAAQERSDQLLKKEQERLDHEKEREAHSESLENQLEAAQKRSEELQTLIKAKEAAQRAVIDNKSREVSQLQKRVDELQDQLDSQVAVLRSTLQVLKASQPKSEDGIVESIIAAIEKGLPIVTPPTPEQKIDDSVRNAYGSRIERMDAVYRRVVGESGKAPARKPNANRAASTEAGDHEIAEYVLSSLEVALPQRPSERGAGQSLPTGSPAKTGASRTPQSGPPTTTAPPVPDKELFEPAERAILVNYRKWEPKLYSGSRLDPSSIRLVEILPPSPNDPNDKIAVRFGVHLLDEVTMEYEGLSYVCGAPEPARYIIVNDVEVPVNPNLYDALFWLRKRDSVRRMWIDAISINQMSSNEKSKEVQRMGPIYSRAKTVNIFLGAPKPSKSTSISIFLKFLNRDGEGEAADRYAGRGLRTLEEICEKCQTDVHDVYKGFIEVCRQPWWRRVWTLDIRQQEFYLAKDEPIFYWGSEHASNASLKRDFNLLMNSLRAFSTSKNANGRVPFDHDTTIAKAFDSFKFEIDRISTFISRRYRTDGFDYPRRLYRELTSESTNPRDFVYGLRAIFDPVFGRVFVPDYQMRTEMLFAILAVFLIQFECWGDVLWWYPTRYAAGKDLLSWLPDFTKRNKPHEYDVQPLDKAVIEKPEPKLVVMNHRLHAEGYILDKVYGHLHLDEFDGEKIFQLLWQFDHSLCNNHECHDYFAKSVVPGNLWLGVFLEMHRRYEAHYTFTSAFKGQLLQSTMKPEDGKNFPRQVAECMPCWDLLRWHALRTATDGLTEALGDDINEASPPYLKDVFSSRMETVFREAFADFFIGACIYDWNHICVWLRRFPGGTAWSSGNSRYWSSIHDSLSIDIERRAQAIADGYSVYEKEIASEVMRVSWCYSFYYTYLAYVILLDCDDHASLVRIIDKLQTAGKNLRRTYSSTGSRQIEKLASAVSSVATRVGHYKTVVDLFRGRYLVWTDGGFRGISCPGVEACCDKTSVVAIVDGLSFPVIVRDYDEKTGEGSLVGCALIRGVDMLDRDSKRAGLPQDYKRGEKRIFKFR